jgi:methylated-DNA-[protein]-cysteine S-methyltransferase
VTLACLVLPAPPPIGALTLGVTARGLALVVFGDHPDAVARAAARLGAAVVDDAARTAAAAEQLSGYLAGGRRAFDVELDWSLTAGAQQRVLRVLSATAPFGTTTTYGELARRAGAASPRGIGSIMGSNPLPVVVPCHRVLGADGLGGFGGGRAVKEWLLAHEGLLTPALEFP